VKCPSYSSTIDTEYPLSATQAEDWRDHPCLVLNRILCPKPKTPPELTGIGTPRIAAMASKEVAPSKPDDSDDDTYFGASFFVDEA